MIRAFHHYVSARKLAFFLVETSAIAIASWLGAALTSLTLAHPQSPVSLPQDLRHLTGLTVGFVLCFQAALYITDLYNLRVAREDRHRGIRILRAAGLAAVAMAFSSLLLHLKPPDGLLFGGAVGAMAGTVLVRTAFRAVVGDPTRILIVGRGRRARWLSKLLEQQGEEVFQVCGMIEPRQHEGPCTVHEPLEAASQRLRADYVVMACDEARGAAWVEGLLKCRIAGRRTYDLAGFCERVLRRIPVLYLRASDLAFSDDLYPSRANLAIRRACDVVASVALLLFTSPLLVLAALAIKLDSRGPIFYRQERVGRGGRSFMLWKFRSMRVDAERNGAVWARPNDGRVTRVGRLMRKARIDEIPQVINVLLGQMSFVGPRPERPVFVEDLKKKIPFYELRGAVNPGITGWAQIQYPYGASVEDARNKLELDLYYVKNGSLFLDLAIVFHTIRHVLLGRGAR
jgi:sugar transferase (PEP-CTERM system associated)